MADSICNSASSWRLLIGRRLGAAYAQDPSVAAVLAAGSTGRGHADRYSDLELGVFWHRQPSETQRRVAAQRGGADLHALYPLDATTGAWYDDLHAGRARADLPNSGLLVEVVHLTIPTVDRRLDDLLVRWDPDEEKQSLAAALTEGVALHNPALIGAWRQRAASYPRELAVAAVKRYGQIDHFWRWEMLLARGSNLPMLYEEFGAAVRRMLLTLMAVNRVYAGGWKWLDRIAARLVASPPNLADRLRSVYRLQPAAGAAELASLVEQTYDIVERELPEVDVERLREIFRYRRPAWEAPPPA